MNIEKLSFASSVTLVVVEDKERFDTTIGIPTNLADGIYILQTAMLVGNGYSPYYSCGKLEITGGNPDLTDCQTDEEPITYDCHKSAGPHIIGHFLHTGKLAFSSFMTEFLIFYIFYIIGNSVMESITQI